MKIYEIAQLNEEYTQPPTLMSVAEYLKDHCAPFLSQCGNEFVYRGKLSEQSDLIQHYDQRSDRIPRDTHPELHKLIDDYFLKRFGHNYRSDVTFGTGNLKDAQYYGNAFVLFPKGQFTFCWSPEIEDLHGYLEGTMDSDDDLFDILDNGNYRTSDLQAAIKSGNEIMFNCPQRFFSVQIESDDFIADLQALLFR